MARTKEFETVEAMQAAIDAYKKSCERKKRPLTVQGLALALGFTSRTSLLNYEGYTDIDNKPFLNTIKRAKLEIEEDKVTGAMMGEYNNAIVIFDLKNNHGHKDKTEVEQTNIEKYSIIEDDQDSTSED